MKQVILRVYEVYRDVKILQTNIRKQTKLSIYMNFSTLLPKRNASIYEWEILYEHYRFQSLLFSTIFNNFFLIALKLCKFLAKQHRNTIVSAAVSLIIRLC